MNQNVKPKRVEDIQRYWSVGPRQISDRCIYWIQSYMLGFKPNKRIRTMSYHGSAEFYGVYIWEYNNIIYYLEENCSYQ